MKRNLVALVIAAACAFSTPAFAKGPVISATNPLYPPSAMELVWQWAMSLIWSHANVDPAS